MSRRGIALSIAVEVMPPAKKLTRMARLSLIFLFLLAACRVPEYGEVKNLVQVTRYLSATRFDKEFYFRKYWAISAVDPKFSKEQKERWTAMQSALWDFQSFNQSFYEVTLEQKEADIWDKPFEFLDSKIGKKTIRSLDIYYTQGHQLWRDYKDKDMTPERKRLLTGLYFLGFDLGLEEDIARLVNPLMTEAEYKVKHGKAPDAEDEDFKDLSDRKLRKELRRIRALEREQRVEPHILRDLSIRFSLLTEDDLAALLREQSKPELIDMGRIEHIALAESMAFQLEDFIAAGEAVAPAAAAKDQD